MNNRNTALLSTVTTVPTVPTVPTVTTVTSYTSSGAPAHCQDTPATLHSEELAVELMCRILCEHDPQANTNRAAESCKPVLCTLLCPRWLVDLSRIECDTSAPPPASHCVSPSSYSQYNCLLHITRFIASYYHNMQYFQCLW